MRAHVDFRMPDAAALGVIKGFALQWAHPIVVKSVYTIGWGDEMMGRNQRGTTVRLESLHFFKLFDAIRTYQTGSPITNRFCQRAATGITLPLRGLATGRLVPG